LARVIRDGEQIIDSKISSLKRFQEDVKDVQRDFECGIGVAGFNDVQEGDIIETYVIKQKSKITL
jgi:translation initiation factor IF-2